MELMGILFSLSILAHFQMTTKISSDYEAAVKSVNNLKESRKVIKAKSRDAPPPNPGSKFWNSKTLRLYGSRDTQRNPILTRMTGQRICGGII